jgi:small subunit ribosomal protein S2
MYSIDSCSIQHHLKSVVNQSSAGRQLALNRQTRILSRFSSTGTPVETAVETPAKEVTQQPGSSASAAKETGSVALSAKEAWRKRELQSERERTIFLHLLLEF